LSPTIDHIARAYRFVADRFPCKICDPGAMNLRSRCHAPVDRKWNADNVLWCSMCRYFRRMCDLSPQVPRTLAMCIFAGCVGPVILLSATPVRRGRPLLMDYGGGAGLATGDFLPALQAEHGTPRCLDGRPRCLAPTDVSGRPRCLAPTDVSVSIKTLYRIGTAHFAVRDRHRKLHLKTDGRCILGDSHAHRQ